MSISDCGNYQYEAVPEAEATVLKITTMPGSARNFVFNYKIKSADAVVSANRVVDRIKKDVPGVNEAKYDWTEESMKGIDHHSEHAGQLKVTIQNRTLESANEIVGEIFGTIESILEEEREYFRGIEKAADMHAVSKFEEYR
jgi:hypothetical protein